MQYGRILKTLILCPVVVCENWRREFEAHSKVGDKVVVLEGSQQNRIKIYGEHIAKGPNWIFVTNYEALQMKELLQLLLLWSPEVLVCDESQRLKNPQAGRTQASALLARGTKHNYILSGSPIINSALDIFSQYLILDRGATFGTKFYAFRAQYFEDENAGMPGDKHFAKWQIRDEVMDVVNQMIYRKATRVMKEECLDLPPLVRKVVEVELAPEQRRLYNELKTQFVAFLENGQECTAQVAIVKALRLQQIVTGYVKPDGAEEIHLKHNPRLDALESELEDIGPVAKTIVWARFKENYKAIKIRLDKMGIKYVELHGGVGPKDRQKNIDAFQNDPQVQVILANQQAAGLGVNLTAASYMIYYSKDFSLENDLQSQARNHRGGSEIHQKITRIDLVARRTIDEVIDQALDQKLDLATRILELKDKLR